MNSTTFFVNRRSNSNNINGKKKKLLLKGIFFPFKNEIEVSTIKFKQHDFKEATEKICHYPWIIFK